MLKSKYADLCLASSIRKTIVRLPAGLSACLGTGCGACQFERVLACPARSTKGFHSKGLGGKSDLNALAKADEQSDWRVSKASQPSLYSEVGSGAPIVWFLMLQGGYCATEACRGSWP